MLTNRPQYAKISNGQSKSLYPVKQIKWTPKGKLTMKKKILLAVVAIICLLSMVLAGCSNIKIENVDEDVIKVLQDAIANSEQ